MKRFLAALVLVACLGAPAAQTPPRVVVVSDVHGDLAQFVTALTQAGVIDAKRKWAGGTTVLVQTGDVPDRGPDSRKVMDLLMDLEKQSKKAGGAVHALLGNHEVMNMVGDLRYVSPGEYASYRSARAAELREHAFSVLADPARLEDAAYREAWLAERPLGWVELQQAFGPKFEDQIIEFFLIGGGYMRVSDGKIVVCGVHPVFDPVLADFGQPSSDRLLSDFIRGKYRLATNAIRSEMPDAEVVVQG